MAVPQGETALSTFGAAAVLSRLSITRGLGWAVPQYGPASGLANYIAFAAQLASGSAEFAGSNDYLLLSDWATRNGVSGGSYKAVAPAGWFSTP